MRHKNKSKIKKQISIIDWLKGKVHYLIYFSSHKKENLIYLSVASKLASKIGKEVAVYEAHKASRDALCDNVLLIGNTHLDYITRLIGRLMLGKFSRKLWIVNKVDPRPFRAAVFRFPNPFNYHKNMFFLLGGSPLVICGLRYLYIPKDVDYAIFEKGQLLEAGYFKFTTATIPPPKMKPVFRASPKCMKFKNWTIRRTRHFIFYFHFKIDVKKDVSLVIKEAENSYSYICDFLDVKFSKKINCFFYLSRYDIKRETGDLTNGIAFPEFYEIHQLYNNTSFDPHELVHIISTNTIGETKVSLLNEGLCEAICDNWQGIKVDVWSVRFLLQKKIYPLHKMFNNDYFRSLLDKLTYPQAGSFVKFLIDKYGIKKFKEVYTLVDVENFDLVLKRHYNADLRNLENRWQKYLKGTALYKHKKQLKKYYGK